MTAGESAGAHEPGQLFPIRLDVDYADHRSRLTTLFRLPLALPPLLVSVCLAFGAAPAIMASVLLTGRIPDWMFGFQRRVWSWNTSVAAFALGLSDARPQLHRMAQAEASGGTRCLIDPPGEMARWKVLAWKLVTALPHIAVLVVLSVAVVPVTAVTWLLTVVTGRAPRSLHDFVVGVLRWHARVAAYVQSLTDEYPPFSLRNAVGPARRSVAELASLAGLAPACLIAAFAVYIVGLTGTHVTRVVSYVDLATADVPLERAAATVESGRMQLALLADPADGLLAVSAPATGSRYVAFTITVANRRGAGQPVPVTVDAFHLTDADGGVHEPVLVGLDGEFGDGSVGHSGLETATIVFQVPTGGPPLQLTWDVLSYIEVPRRGETIDWIFDP